ncbi:MAG TPA: hypothetical protein PLC76_00230 [Saprospiraceae bacterium]|nr:MAG: hypothetical protein UZ08_BCD001002865 [Candidatus Parvibacillus calidus]MBX2935904.1 hypothetical protein [Saprospiraceae bacterium]MBX7179421.1 hypothetical protein [Saprospiraceae bacterium]MCB0590583.1 hypothetical protein [Saprospiraceae bacterium]MCC7148312.1 hypothetical protein [Saprospiraceae bacterium]
MSIFDKAVLVIYRMAEKGLEVFLVKSEDEEIQSQLVEISEKFLTDLPLRFSDNSKMIELDPIEDENMEKVRAVAIEGDWHDIPSLRAMLREDLQFMKVKMKKYIPTIDSGNFILFKDAVKKAVRSEYRLLKELKDVLTDRNTINNI